MFKQDKWKNKYPIGWCYLCNCAYIICEDKDCTGSSCNGGGCPKCSKDFDEFNAQKHRVEDYLTEEEIKIYQKCERLKDIIVDSLTLGDKEIDWEKMYKADYFCNNDEKLFEKEFKQFKVD